MSDSKARLVSVGIETFLGARYTFPDMDLRMLDKLLPKFSERRPDGSSLTLVNASESVLVVPVRIIKKVTITGYYASGASITEDWWHAPMHELQDAS